MRNEPRERDGSKRNASSVPQEGEELEHSRAQNEHSDLPKHLGVKSPKQENTTAVATGSSHQLPKGMVNDQVYPSKTGKRLPQSSREITKNFQKDLQLNFSCFLDHPSCSFQNPDVSLTFRECFHGQHVKYKAMLVGKCCNDTVVFIVVFFHTNPEYKIKTIRITILSK